MNSTACGTKIALQNILYATDFSTSAEAALPYAISLANRYDAKIHGLNVRPPATYPIAGPESMPIMLETARQLAQAAAMKLNAALAGVAHEVTVCEGPIWPVIDEIVSKDRTDLIVIGTRGRKGVSRFFLGSVAEEIFRQAACPVLTVGPQVSLDTERRLKMKEILYATDYSTESLAALPYAVDFAQEYESRLTLLHVVSEPQVGEFVNAQHYADSIKRRLHTLVKPEAESWCELQCAVAHGHEANKIIETAEALGADMIVLGVRAPNGGIGASTHLLGSVAHEVVTRAQCPVLTVRG